MTLSRASLVERAYLRNQSGAAAGIPLARYDALEPQARAIMFQKLAADKSERVRNQGKKDFTLTVTAGVASLAASLVASEPMLDRALDKATITSTDSAYPWQFLSSYEELSLSRPTFGLIYYTVKNGSLICTNAAGALGLLSTTATTSCNAILLAATFSGNLDLEEMAISTLAELARGQTDEPQQQQ